LLNSKSGLQLLLQGYCYTFIRMNFLAHAYLSFKEPGVLSGNMINDYVKGKKKFDYPLSIQKGMTLHRAIDTFTDQHEVTAQAKQFFRPQYRLYAGAFVDVLYDHFLANDTREFLTEGALNAFCQLTYASLQADVDLLPLKFQQVLPHMQLHNWLYNYRYKAGIEKSFIGLSRRAAYLSESAIAFAIFNEQYDELQHCYNEFFPELKRFAFETLSQLNNT
jgi:acyl carrier protein phosphodiesterase